MTRFKRELCGKLALQQLALAGLTLLGAVACSSADPGYLPSIGPAPLRFQAPSKFSPYAFILPKPTPPAPEPATIFTNQPEKPAAAPVVLPVPLPPPPQVTPMPTNTLTPPPQSDDVISPQMLLKYFNKGTNGTSTSITAPLDFTPPKTVPPASSKAEYSTTP